jgi:hypothetical protein
LPPIIKSSGTSMPLVLGKNNSSRIIIPRGKYLWKK